MRQTCCTKLKNFVLCIKRNQVVNRNKVILKKIKGIKEFTSMLKVTPGALKSDLKLPSPIEPTLDLKLSKVKWEPSLRVEKQEEQTVQLQT